MKLLTTELKLLDVNYGAAREKFMVETFEIEPSDVRTVHSNYLGFRAGKYVIRESDVGRVIEERSQPGYTMWFFKEKS